VDQEYIETTEKILILTEGRSDTQILSFAINAMYPEYADLFQFVDFDEFSISGGASMLTKVVKSFAGVRMKQPILILFDNDAASIAEKIM
jgi:5S rRNA maturation endonuclease (ribonuclease M5)